MIAGTRCERTLLATTIDGWIRDRLDIPPELQRSWQTGLLVFPLSVPLELGHFVGHQDPNECRPNKYPRSSVVNTCRGLTGQQRLVGALTLGAALVLMSSCDLSSHT